MPSSGARSGTRPSRSERGAGTGRVGPTLLACDHPAPSRPSYHRGGRAFYWCDHCAAFKAVRA
jgi:hypothetical protein